MAVPRWHTVPLRLPGWPTLNATSHRLSRRTFARMVCSLAGQSGRIYTQGKMLQRHVDPQFSIQKAESDNTPYIVKRIPRPFYDKFLRLSADLPPSKRLRLHIDCNPEENALIYPYFNGTLLDLIRDDPGLRSTPRVKILRHVAEAIQELHAKDWIHIDVKPDNILVNWTSDAQNNKTVTDAVLGDFDVAHKLAPGDSRQTPYAIGNVMWRSPEGQTGRGVTKASDIFSFGLVCIYTLGGGELLLLNDYEALEAAGIMPEHEILTRHFAYFGPAPPGLLDQVGNETLCEALKRASRIAEISLRDQPNLSIEDWGNELGPRGKDMISGMTNPDPAARLTIEQILAHPLWENDG
ncbi:hypothetical protein BN1708_002900 [Verticillium longisporum]|uniref:Protein kinase domain-containing protein n=1 Tax=Verticillium longisporum TaxID=100787 RepID=A0A0G4L3X1_VERLO|nr:hypothetical protein BN1708_002900 [Verticillium longisporum]